MYITIKKQVDYCNKSVHNILTKDIPLILPNFNNHKRVERGMVTSLETSFTGLTCERIISYLHIKRQNT